MSAVGRALGRLFGRLGAVDTDRLLGAVVAVGAVLALTSIALAGFLTGLAGSFLTSLLYAFALLLPAVGLFLVVTIAHRLIREERGTHDPVRSPPPEAGVTEADWSVGRETQLELSGATASQYRCHDHLSAGKIRSRLRRGAVNRVRTRHGHDEETASALVAAGEWTDDPVAAAFLSAERQYPLADRIRAAFDPGQAYCRRVCRTLDAIEGQGYGSTASPESEADDEESTERPDSGDEATAGEESAPEPRSVAEPAGAQVSEVTE